MLWVPSREAQVAPGGSCWWQQPWHTLPANSCLFALQYQPGNHRHQLGGSSQTQQLGLREGECVADVWHSKSCCTLQCIVLALPVLMAIMDLKMLMKSRAAVPGRE